MATTKTTTHFEVQGRLKGDRSEKGWFRLGGLHDEPSARREHVEYTGPMYEGLRRTTDVRLARITTVTTEEEI